MTDLCPNCGSKVTFADPKDKRPAAFNDENPAWSCNSCGRSGDTLELEAAEREAAATAMSTDDLLDQLDNAAMASVYLGRLASGWTASAWSPDAQMPAPGRGLNPHAALAALVAQLDQVKA